MTSLALPPVHRRWVLRGAASDEDTARRIARALQLPIPMCRLLVSRGVTDAAAARRFLRPELDALHAPDTLPDLEPALDRIERAIDGDETVLVHGDYDVDGIAGTALVTRTLQRLGARAEPYVPHRVSDGYDLGPSGVRAAAEAGAGLIVTVDCGIVAHEGVRAAGDAGIDVIVTDHHTPGDRLPDAHAVVNPNREGCRYPNRDLCGAGVAFKLCRELVRRRGGADEAVLYDLDLVALATIADLVPLAGENRVLAHYGLRVLQESRKPGVRALVRRSGLADRHRFGAGHVSHILAPRLNAAGRMAHARLGVLLLLTEDEREADRIALQLEERNRERRDVDRAILAEALERLEESYSREDRVVVLDGNWHPGVIGIVASRIVERVHRPTVLIARGDGAVARGSARSIPGFDVFAAIRACAEHLERYGGHRAAAGFDIHDERIPAFREALSAHAREQLAAEPVAKVSIDQELTLDEVTPELFRYTRHIGPFGMGNPTPVFAVRAVRAAKGARVVGDGHIKLRLEGHGARLDAIGFRLADRLGDLFRSGAPVDVAFQLHEDRYRGRTTWQAKLVDARPAEDAGEAA